MFKKILIPTDGSPLSAQAANAGITFARSIGAEVLALNVTQPFAATIGFDGMAAAYAITDEDYEKAAYDQADNKTGKHKCEREIFHKGGTIRVDPSYTNYFLV